MASRGSVVVPGVGGVGGWPSSSGCLLRSGPWSLNLLWSRVAPVILVSQSQVVMERWSVEGQDTGSGVSKMETTAGARQQSGFICSAADNFQHTQNPFVRSFCFSLMSSDAESILGTIYRVSLFWIYYS